MIGRLSHDGRLSLHKLTACPTTVNTSSIKIVKNPSRVIRQLRLCVKPQNYQTKPETLMRILSYFYTLCIFFIEEWVYCLAVRITALCYATMRTKMAVQNSKWRMRVYLVHCLYTWTARSNTAKISKLVKNDLTRFGKYFRPSFVTVSV